MRNLRAGLIGMGSIGRQHARILCDLDGVELIGVVDPRESGMDSIRRFNSLDELLGYDLDYCVVAVPTAQHAGIALRLAESGVHALVEKPLADSSSTAQMVTDAFDNRGLVGGVGHVERFNAAVQEARKRVQAGQLGQIYQIATRRQGPFPQRIADVGVVKDLATHDIDLTAWITDSSYMSVAAKISHKAGRVHEDLVSVTAQMTNGIVINHLVNWLSPFKERTVMITGERGSFVIDTLTGDLTFFDNGQMATEWEELAQFRGVSEGDVIRYAIPKPEPLRTEHECFRDSILGAQVELVSLAEGTRVLQVAEAILESATEGRTVVL